jgi:hypothetical protein
MVEDSKTSLGVTENESGELPLMHNASFNNDQDSISIALTTGFMCISVEPFAVQVYRPITGGLNFI